MLTFFNRSHTESVTVDYCDFLDEALKESVEYLSSSGFKFYCLHPEVANWMGTDVSSVEEIRKRIRHAQKNEMFLFEINCGNHSRYWFHFQSFSGFTLMDGWDSFKGNIAVVSKKNASAFLGKPKEAVTEEEVLKRFAKEAEIIEQAINGDLFEVCGPQSDDFCRHGWFLNEEDAAKFAEEESPDFKYKNEDFRTIYELKTA